MTARAPEPSREQHALEEIRVTWASQRGGRDCGCGHLAQDGKLCAFHVAYYTIRSALDNLAHLRAQLGEARVLLGEAVGFVELAAGADNSGREYPPMCQECERTVGHNPVCRLVKWLGRAASVLAGDATPTEGQT